MYLGHTLTVNGNVTLGNQTSDTVDVSGILKIQDECPIVDIRFVQSWAGVVSSCEATFGANWSGGSDLGGELYGGYGVHGGHHAGDGVLESYVCIKRHC